MANLATLKETFSAKLESASNLKDLDALKIEFLGKSGHIQEQMKKIGALAPDERKAFGAEINEVKEFISAALEHKTKLLQTLVLQQKLDSETIDITLPPYTYQPGKVHPLSQSILELKDIFSRLGFISVDGPEIDDDWHNFTALNIPEHHPARQNHDTFYTLKAGISCAPIPRICRSAT
jgi:phenylalanyl-tRNA synthetase alpha chain